MARASTHAVTKVKYRLESVDRVMAVLESFEKQDTLTLSEVARVTDLSEATALRYLANLQRHGLLERDEVNRYRIGIRLFQLGQRALTILHPRTVAESVMKGLREQFGETVILAVRDKDNLVVIEALESTHSIRMGARVGESDTWHASSLGKAILAALPESEVRGILERCGMPRYTTATFVSVEAFAEELGQARQRGYAVDNEENAAGLRCVGAAILDHRGDPRYAISVSGPAARIGDSAIDVIGQAVQTAAAQASELLGHRAGSDGPTPLPERVGESGQ